jgi:SEC-C motif
MNKPGRNDPCPCGSGKKYKKCCELKEKHRKFEATQLSSTQLSGKMGSLFQRNVSANPIEVSAKKKDIVEDKDLSE